jgi:hypothetical protein
VRKIYRNCRCFARTYGCRLRGRKRRLEPQRCGRAARNRPSSAALRSSNIRSRSAFRPIPRSRSAIFPRRRPTLDVVKVISGPPADFPPGAKLSVPAKGDGKLEAGYASGPIGPGKSVTVTLVKAGTYLIGCAFHYDEGMRDVLVVEAHASPGPQATPTPKTKGGGSGSGSGW